MLSVRCSSLPLYMRCSQSVRGEIEVNEWFPETELGRAVHAAAAQWLSGAEPDIAVMAVLYGVDADDLGFLFSQVLKAWASFAPPPTDRLHTETPLRHQVTENLVLTGTPDVLIERNAGDVVQVVDWKTGRRDADHREQMMGYMALTLRNFRASRALSRIVWLRDMEAEMYSMGRDELVAWENRLEAQGKDNAYRPGPHCKWCPRRFSCQARAEMQSSSLAILGAAQGRALSSMTPSEQLSLYKRARDIANLADRVIEEMRTVVEQTGPVEADGTRLEIVAEKRRNVLPTLAWPVLQKYLPSDESLASCITVHLTKVEAEIAANMPRGQGAATKRAFVADMDAARAISHSVVRKLTERRSGT